MKRNILYSQVWGTFDTSGLLQLSLLLIQLSYIKFCIYRYGAPLAPVVSYDYPATTVAPTTQTTAAVAEATEEVSTVGHIYVATNQTLPKTRRTP